MACHEIAALRIALHTQLGSRPDHEKAHEIEELGAHIHKGALGAIANARDLATTKRALEVSASELEAKVAAMDAAAPSLGYHRALVVTVRSTQRALDRIIADIERFYLDIEDTHDLLHEVYPGSDADADAADAPGPV
ncbi:MAG: DUF3209 family protein [Pseudomonadota bacterium]|nr:DUF3209 family protein [Pseudomonadota bacterium]